MLRLKVPRIELFNESTQKFVYFSEQDYELEHSLSSLSKWESKWKLPFLSTTDKTSEQVIDYVSIMMLTEGVSELIIQNFPESILNQIKEYIADEMTATKFYDQTKPTGPPKIITAELIYYWMISLNIPLECQHWHLNRLLTLIRVCNEKNSPPKKMSRSALAARNRELNAARLAKYNAKG